MFFPLRLSLVAQVSVGCSSSHPLKEATLSGLNEKRQNLFSQFGEPRQKINVWFPGLVVYLQAKRMHRSDQSAFNLLISVQHLQSGVGCSAIAEKVWSRWETHKQFCVVADIYTCKRPISIFTQTWFDVQDNSLPVCFFLILSAPQQVHRLSLLKEMGRRIHFKATEQALKWVNIVLSLCCGA